MAEAVEFLLENLLQLLINHENLIKVDVKEEKEKIENYLHRFKAFLANSTVKQRKHQNHRELIHQLRELVYDLEDTFDGYVSEQAQLKSKNYFARFIRSPINDHLVVKERVQSVCKVIESSTSFMDVISSLNVKDDHQRRLNQITQPAALIREMKVVGLDDDTEMVVKYLHEERKELDVITIVGMPGIGKTTLAWRAFLHEAMTDEFPIRIWINVSNEFIRRDVFLAILKECTQLSSDDIDHKDEEELARLAASHLEEKKFLIVMDDVWSASDWDSLRIALPESTNKNSKVLITSCNGEVGRHVNRRGRLPLKVRFLTQSESWSLLKSEVFGEQECPPELESLGRLIANQCDGLPQAILAMARTLAEEDLSSSDMRERRIGWTKAASRVPQYRTRIFYDSLPYHLRLCFLYFGMFPYNSEISVWKLTRMWIAEGFIQQRQGSNRLEETAETYLQDLINRNLVEVCRIKSDGKVKTCRVHRMIHEFCKIEARSERENFIQEIKFRDGVWEPDQLSNIHRRLCIHSNVLDFVSSEPSGPHVRSFVCFSDECIDMRPGLCSAIPKAFKLLRVLDVMPIRFTMITNNMYRLLNLRYLVISFDSNVLPRHLSRLLNLQTLVVNTKSRTLTFIGSILDLTKLRHFKTDGPSILTMDGKTSDTGKKDGHLQTLGMISPESCTEDLLDGARDLKELGIRGQLSWFLEGNTGSFDRLGKLENLNSMKLVNDVNPYPASERRVHSLPPAYKYPPRLKSLTLANTYLDWSQMSILGSLERLEVLKLKDKAFMGPNWVTDDRGFDSLQALHIGHTDLVIWVASAHQFPRLRLLKLHYCEKLQEVPIELADAPCFQRLELLNTKLAAASAVRIADEINKRPMNIQEGTPSRENFKLSIFPPVEY